MANNCTKLKYVKYKNMGNVVTIQLHNNYTIIALIGKNEAENYDVELRIKRDDVEKWDLIEKAEHIIFDASVNVQSAILKTVDDYLQKGFFDHYIRRYEYELKCFSIGNEKEEEKRLGNEYVISC